MPGIDPGESISVAQGTSFACLGTQSVNDQCLSALLTRENMSLEPGEDEAARLPPVTCLMLVTVILILKSRRFEWTVTAMWIASRVQAHRSKPLQVALSQVGYFFTRTDGLCAAGSNRDAVGATQRCSDGIEAAFRAAFGHRTA